MSFTIFDLWLIVIVLIFTIYGSRTNALNQITGIVSMFISALVTKLFFYKLSVSVGGQFQEQKDTDLVVYLISFIVIYVLTLILLRILVYYKELQIEGLQDQIIAILVGAVRNLLRISFLIMILKSWSVIDLESRTAYIPLMDSVIFSYCEIVSNILFKF